jgi:DNA helicase-2/ATP-dependent DNA helicase PcrA
MSDAFDSRPAAPSDPSELLAALDPDQRAVAENLTGPLCVLAGAGTGKTRAITYRIAYGVGMGVYDPRHLLAVTFTARAAGELRSRLRDLGAGAVQARTFHAAALRQLSYFWPRVGRGSSSTRRGSSPSRPAGWASARTARRCGTSRRRSSGRRSA